MIYTIERRHEFGYGTMESHYELRAYEGKSEHTGALLGGKALKRAKTKKDILSYCRRANISPGDLIERWQVYANNSHPSA